MRTREDPDPVVSPWLCGKTILTESAVFVESKHQDLSAFGTDLAQSNKIRCRIKNKTVQLILNDVLIDTLSYQQAIGSIMGINFIFHGAGAVDYVRLYNERGAFVYEDEFDFEVLSLTLSEE